MDQHAGGLVEHQQIPVLVHDIQGTRGGQDAAAPLRVGQADGQSLSLPGAEGGIHPGPVHQDAVL